MTVPESNLYSVYTLISGLHGLREQKCCLRPKHSSSDKSLNCGRLDSHFSKVAPHFFKAVSSWRDDVCVDVSFTEGISGRWGTGERDFDSTLCGP